MSQLHYTNAHQAHLGRIIPDLIRHRSVLWSLISKEQRARYRNAAIGFSWAVLHPLLMMLVLTFVFSYLLNLRPPGLRGERDVPYAIFVLCGIIFWQYTANSLNFATNSLITNHDLIKKVYFPREIIPLASVGDCFINLLIGILLFLALSLVYVGAPGLAALWTPVILLIQTAMIIGLALALSCLNAFFRDVRYIVEVLLMFGFYVTPTFYAYDDVIRRATDHPFLFTCYNLNPMLGIITAYRDVLLYNRAPEHAALLAWSAVFSLFVLVAGASLFRSRSAVLSDQL